MTNTQIIIREALMHGLYTPEQIEDYIRSGHTIPLHTFRTWKEAGYKVKKGEHARVTTMLWKYTIDHKEVHEGQEVDGVNRPHYYLSKAFLFGEDQVEKIEEAADDK